MRIVHPWYVHPATKNPTGQRWRVIATLALATALLALQGCTPDSVKELERDSEQESRARDAVKDYVDRLNAPIQASALGMRSFRVSHDEVTLTKVPKAPGRYVAASRYWFEGTTLDGQDVAVRRTLTLSVQLALTRRDDKPEVQKQNATEEPLKASLRWGEWGSAVLSLPVVGLAVVLLATRAYKSCLWWVAIPVLLGCAIAFVGLGQDGSELLFFIFVGWWLLWLWAREGLLRVLGLLLYVGFTGFVAYQNLGSNWWWPMILLVIVTPIASSVFAAIAQQLDTE